MEQRENEENLEKVRAFSKPKCFPSPRPLSTSQWMINVNNETFRKKRRQKRGHFIKRKTMRLSGARREKWRRRG
jgi:hypothetical protein